MTPIFSRSWFVKRQIVSVRLSVPASLRSAWLISRAWRPTWLSPISPSISAFGVSAATESTATMSTAPERTSSSAISSACSPVSGCETSSSSMFDADPARVGRVHRVLRVDERADPAAPLRLGDHVVDERRLARRLRPEDLDDAAARQPADAEGEVERERAGRDRADRDLRRVAHAHHRALAELPLDLAERDVERFLPVHAIHPPAVSETRSSTSYRAPDGCSRDR